MPDPITANCRAGDALTPLSGTATQAGDTPCVTPAAGNRLRVFYLSYNPEAPVTAAFRFGTGALWLLNAITANSVVSKDCNIRYLQGGINEALILNLSGAVTTHWTVFYQEVQG